MIRSLQVDGFKSLRKFSAEFSPGINVLIGPNGSGKTSICQAIGLVSAGCRGSGYRLPPEQRRWG